jgi:hypothetical protein
MNISVARGGKFVCGIDAKELARGLRPTRRAPRNSGLLSECDGLVGREGVLQALDSLTALDVSVITDGFPFPQIFVFTNVIIACGLLDIYEWKGSSLSLECSIDAAYAGGIWTAVDFFDYIYLSNGDVAVVRNSDTYTYTVSSAVPHSTSACNFNGQLILGAPDTAGLAANMVFPTTPIELTTTIDGDYT